MLKTMKFDALALVQPKGRDDVAAIIAELRSELDNLHTHLDAVEAECKKDLQPA